jgi:hypothetical protein
MPIMSKTLNPSLSSRKFITAAFVLSYLHWIFLFFTIRMEMIHDALGWEMMANLLYKKGWVDYLTTGPHREPFYPLVISFSMRIADFIGIPYQTVQTVIQVIILLTTQWLVYRLLTRLKVHHITTALAVLYIGFSPILVNSTFTLYCEIMTCPFVLGVVLLGVHSWRALSNDGGYKKVILPGVLLSIIFLILTFTRAVFLCVFPLYLIPFAFLTVVSFFKKRKKTFLKSVLFLLVAVTLYQIPVTSYKFANKKYNGQFTFTDRGPWALYGNTVRRLEKMYPKRVLAGLANATGVGTCRFFFGKEECAFWGGIQSDHYGLLKVNELKQAGLSLNEINSELISLSMKKILKNPLQYTFFMGLESFKMFFWESTRVGFVIQPDWRKRLFGFTPFKNSLRGFTALLAIFAFISLIKTLTEDRKKILRPASVALERENYRIRCFILLLTSCVIFMYSFFLAFTRYVIPIAPLYIIMIALFLDKSIFKTTSCNS